MHANSQEDKGAGEVGAQAGAKGEQASDNGNDREEQGDDVERPADAAHVVVVVAVLAEGLRQAGGGAEVVHGREGHVGGGGQAVGVQTSALVHAAEAQPSPSHRVQNILSTSDAIKRCLQKVDLVLRGGLQTGEDDEELEHNTSEEEDQSQQAEQRT